MIIKSLCNEDFVNYKEPSMLIAFPRCTFKCEKDCGDKVCQNGTLATAPDIEISVDAIIHRYLFNNITSAIVFAGLEPFDSFVDVKEIIHKLRVLYGCNDTVVIYTGYTEDEAKEYIDSLKHFGNIIVKFGRYVPGGRKHHDDVLGVDLASDNQYAIRI